jgi:serine/threonine protein kinase
MNVTRFSGDEYRGVPMFLTYSPPSDDDVSVIFFIMLSPKSVILTTSTGISSFDALHMKDDVEFSEKERITIIQHTAQGLQYLHDSNIAHCDMKSQNILLSYEPDDNIPVLVVKITDFGLSMMKNNTDTSSSAGGEYVRNIGTPRYSSPENLRGELLNVKGLMMSDGWAFTGITIPTFLHEKEY